MTYKYPFIIEAAKEIWYDNGMINRFESESSKVEKLNSWLLTLDQNSVAEYNQELANMSFDDMYTICCGEESEAEELASTSLHIFLNRIFDEEYEGE